jgi:hypothetical protein
MQVTSQPHPTGWFTVWFGEPVLRFGFNPTGQVENWLWMFVNDGP